MSKKKQPKAKKPLTPKQRLAINRRHAERECAKTLDDIASHLSDPFYGIPPNYRANTAHALVVLLQGGHVFALACAKAYLARTFMPRDHDIAATEFWAFVDEQNALFAARIPPDMVQRWNAPDYDLPATNPPVEQGGVR